MKYLLIKKNVDIVDISGHRSQKVSQVTVKWQQWQQAGLRQAHQFADKGWLYQIHFARMYLFSFYLNVHEYLYLPIQTALSSKW